MTDKRGLEDRLRDRPMPCTGETSSVTKRCVECILKNFVGRLDPPTGEIKLKPVPTPHAVPYGIVALPSGVPYFCEFGTNKLASIDPKTMTITEYPVPQGARPRRLAVAPDGTIFSTDYERGYLGHFDPASKKVEEWKSPGGDGSEPYGITVTTDGIVWYSKSGVKPNTLVRFVQHGCDQGWESLSGM
jgi:virginiamycin B lyase